MLGDDVVGIPSRSARASERSPPSVKCSCRPRWKALVAGSGLTFEDAGEHELNGVGAPGRISTRSSC
jgi:hypothetical protein